jgi:hypothetical protein
MAFIWLWKASCARQAFAGSFGYDMKHPHARIGA